MSRWQQAIESAGELPDYLVIGGERIKDSNLGVIETRDPASGLLLWYAGVEVRQQIDRLALIETLDTGKPLKDACAGVRRHETKRRRSRERHGRARRLLRNQVGYDFVVNPFVRGSADISRSHGKKR